MHLLSPTWSMLLTIHTRVSCKKCRQKFHLDPEKRQWKGNRKYMVNISSNHLWASLYRTSNQILCHPYLAWLLLLTHPNLFQILHPIPDPHLSLETKKMSVYNNVSVLENRHMHKYTAHCIWRVNWLTKCRMLFTTLYISCIEVLTT